MPAKEECLAHIQKSVNMINAFMAWEAKASIKALALGIQGKKRESGAQMIKALNIMKCFQREAFDLFEAEIYPSTQQALTFPDISGIEQFFVEYRRGLWAMYWESQEAANTFVAPLCMRHLSKLLYEHGACIRTEIVDVNRKIKRWNDMKSYGTSLHDLYIYETTEYNNHDEAEKQEKEFGYDS